MREKPDALTVACLLIFAVAMVWIAGCGAPPATVELIAVAQKALKDTSAAAADHHAAALRQLDSQAAALDAAFDADVKLAEAGKIRTAQGQPVRLSAEWVISARKGYAAARDALAGQRSHLESAHAADLDNLAAASEALDLAGRLILQQYALTERTRQIVHSLTRRLIRE